MQKYWSHPQLNSRNGGSTKTPSMRNGCPAVINPFFNPSLRTGTPQLRSKSTPVCSLIWCSAERVVYLPLSRKVINNHCWPYCSTFFPPFLPGLVVAIALSGSHPRNDPDKKWPNEKWLQLNSGQKLCLKWPSKLQKSIALLLVFCFRSVLMSVLTNIQTSNKIQHIYHSAINQTAGKY